MCGLGLNSEWDLCTPSGCVYVSDVSVCVCVSDDRAEETQTANGISALQVAVYVLDVSVCMCVR